MKKRVIAFLMMVFICGAFVLPFPAVADEPVAVTGTVPLIQTGSFSGNQTIPSDISVFALNQTAEQKLYAALLEALEARQKTIQLSQFGVSVSTFRSVFQQVVNDNPRLFYVTGGYSGSHIGGIMSQVSPSYSDYTQEMQREFDAAVKKALDYIDPDLSPLEQALLAHDYLVSLCHYDWETATTGELNGDHLGTAYGAFVDHNVVCQGYTLAYKILMQELGIPCVYALSEGMNHIWNVIQLDGEWYHIDLTWDDYVPDIEGFVRHMFFLISDETIADEDHGHYGWAADVVCTDKSYESGYVFCEMSEPIHYWEDEFYYVDGAEICRGDLTGTAVEKVGDFPLSFGPVAWVGGEAYYVGTTGYRYDDVRIMRFDLETGAVSAVSDAVDFVETASPDGAYPAGFDYPGIRLSDEGTHMEVVSSTRREVLISAEIPHTPLAWEGLELEEDEEVRPVGIHRMAAGLKAGVLVSEEMQGSCVLWVAFYRGEKMVAIRSAQIGAGDAQLQVIDLGSAITAQWDEYRMMLTRDSVNMEPVCDVLREVS